VPLTPKRESVWDYPRPPKVEAVTERISVRFAGEVIADTTRARRVLETSHPPVYYLPPDDVRLDLLVSTPGRSSCEFKGEASYVTIVTKSRRSERAGWLYENPTSAFHSIAGYLAFYASRVDEAKVGDEVVLSQPGDFYGGWVTSWVTGPFKGAPGTMGW
jgi:uncharacterized protein (DUF427 family)